MWICLESWLIGVGCSNCTSFMVCVALWVWGCVCVRECVCVCANVNVTWLLFGLCVGKHLLSSNYITQTL